MFVTKLGIVPIPEPYATKLKHKKIDLVPYNEALEVAAWLKGQPASARIIEVALDFVDGVDNTLDDYFHRCKPLPNLPGDDRIELVCNDGYSIHFSKSYLQRRFQFIEDYLSEFPNEKTITIPFPSDTVSVAVDHLCDANDEESSLLSVIDCVSFLNPKSALYYFRFTTEKVPAAKLIELYSLLTEHEKMELIRVRSQGGRLGLRHTLPHSPLGPLAHLLEASANIDRLVEIFSDYPSYLATTFACYLSYTDDKDVQKAFDRIMLTADFSQSSEVCELHDDAVKALMKAIVSLLKRVGNREGMKRILTMIRAKHELFGNKDDYVPAPYFTKFSFKQFTWPGAVIGEIAIVSGVDYNIVTSILL